MCFALFPPRLPATQGAIAAPQLLGRWACSVLSWVIALQPENASLHPLSLRPPLSQLKRASSEDTLNKPGGAAASGAARLKKTSTSGAVSELAESRLRGPPGRRARGGGQVGGTQGGGAQAGAGGTGGRDPGGGRRWEGPRSKGPRQEGARSEGPRRAFSCAFESTSGIHASFPIRYVPSTYSE